MLSATDLVMPVFAYCNNAIAATWRLGGWRYICEPRQASEMQSLKPHDAKINVGHGGTDQHGLQGLRNRLQEPES